MREFASPSTYVLPATGNLTDDVVRNGTEHPESVAFSVRHGDEWRDVTAAEFLDSVRDVAGGLAASGVEPGDRVALLVGTRYEWTLLDYAIWFVGAVTVPVPVSSTTDQAADILADCGATALVADTERQLQDLLAVRHRLEDLELSWCLEHDAVAELADAGRAYPRDDLEELRTTAGPDSLATLVYTSGTTGRPKGCRLTHGNFLFELGVALAALDDLFDADDAATLLVLPLADVFARVVQVGAVRSRVRLGHCADVERLDTDLREFRPTFVLAVPRLLEQVLRTAGGRAAGDGHGSRLERALETAVSYSRALEAGRPGALLRLRHALHERWVYARLREAWGGRCRYLLSGGTPLGDRLGHLHRGIGLPVLEAYGLTETTSAVTVNRPDAVKLGTVGRPLGGTTVRVADDGELMVRGSQLSPGYWADPAVAEGAWQADGWLRTGDVGEIDDEGFVRVSGRRTEILVTTGGKNVAPELLEQRLRAHPLVSQCLVVGDGRPFLAALLTLEPEAAARWASAHGKPRSVAALVGDPDLDRDLQAAVDEANKAVSQAESVRRFVVLPVDWTEADGQLTPRHEVRRDVVLQQLRHVVEELYSR